MAVTSREINQRRWQVRLPFRHQLYTTTNLVVSILALTALYFLLSHVVTWGQATWDNMRYGLPRTFHLAADVGHSAATGEPSHLIAMNLDRQIVVLDIPGGDTRQVRTLMGPYLFGADEHLTPVTMRLHDFDGNQAPDLVVRVKDEEIIYMNHDGAFVLITPEERQQLHLTDGAQ